MTEAILLDGFLLQTTLIAPLLKRRRKRGQE
jgi:hypothetical protein